MSLVRAIGVWALGMLTAFCFVAAAREFGSSGVRTPFNTLFASLYLMILTVLCASHLPILGAGWRGLTGLILLLAGIPGLGTVIDEYLYGFREEAWLSFALATALCATATAFIASGRKQVLLEEAQHPNQPLHPDALTRAGERQR